MTRQAAFLATASLTEDARRGVGCASLDARALRTKSSTGFVDSSSIVRRIWGDGDMVLLVFAGSAAEFALNRAVDWLFFTGKLPGDPIGRLFSTARYAQEIIFADEVTAMHALERIRSAHEAVERKRGAGIPEWAHRDVLYMLIDYSAQAHATLDRPLTADELHELYDVFLRVGTGLGIPDLPSGYAAWQADRERHLRRDLVQGEGTAALYAQYLAHLGSWRFRLLLLAQSILVPGHVRTLLGLRRAVWVRRLFRIYPLLRWLGFRAWVHRLLIPSKHLAQVRALDHR